MSKLQAVIAALKGGAPAAAPVIKKSLAGRLGKYVGLPLLFGTAGAGSLLAYQNLKGKSLSEIIDMLRKKDDKATIAGQAAAQGAVADGNAKVEEAGNKADKGFLSRLNKIKISGPGLF